MVSRRKAHLTICTILLCLGAAAAHSTDRDDGDPERARLRCATRLSLALTGQSPGADLLAAADPQAQLDQLLANPDFMNRFARFVNSRLNDEPGEVPAEDATFFLARHILQQDRPWHELFDGPYRVAAITGDNGRPSAEVRDDEGGLGYFRSPRWMRRYAGNEEDGYRLVAAYRIQQNIIGLEIDGVDSAPDMDLTAAGRMAAECRSCHYDSYFALDKVAKVLSRRQGEGNEMSFIPPDEGPQEVLGSHTIASDADLVAALVSSVDFRFRTCRLAFEFLYGRGENSCEAPLFDACVDAFEASGRVQDAIKALAADPGFCE
jgi:hypothetical protein